MKPWMKKGAGKIMHAVNTIRHGSRMTEKKYESGFSPLPAPVLEAFNERRPLGPQPLLCYAPFKMMYFAFGGEVIACCHNRKHLLGRYPESSLMEIWQGEKMEVLRAHIRNDDLSHGCEVCRGLLMSGNFDGAKNALYDRYAAGPWPRTMEFELDNRCNLACVICNGLFSSQHAEEKHSETVYGDDFVEQLRPFIPHLKEAKFYGGEPFLIPVYHRIWEVMQAINPGISILLQTNGTVLNDKIRKLLEGGRFSINVSIDSLDPGRFEAIRKHASFRETMDNTLWFRDYCQRKGTHFGIIPTPCRLNWQDLGNLTHWAGEQGALVYFNTLITPLNLALWNLPPAELEHIHQVLSAFVLPGKNSIQKANARHYRDFLTQLLAWRETNGRLPESGQRQEVPRSRLLEIRAAWMERFTAAVAGHPQGPQMKELFHEVLTGLGPESDLIFLALDPMPIQEVTDELATFDRERVKAAAGKKLFEASGSYRITEA